METFAKFDSKLYLNPKWIMFSTAHPLAAVTWVSSITYSVDNLTDGFIPDMIATRVLGATEDVCTELGEAGMWVRVDGGWQIHGFLDAQQSRKEVEDRKKAKSAAGRAGGRKSSEARRSKNEAPASRVVEAEPNQSEPDTDTDTDTTTTPTPPKGLVADDSKFNEFLEAYPKKANTKASRTEWNKLQAARIVGASTLVGAAKAYAKTVRAKGTDLQWVPQPATWLRDHQWENSLPKSTAPEVGDVWIQDHVTLKLPPGADAWTANKRFRHLIKTGISKEQAAAQTIKEQNQ